MMEKKYDIKNNKSLIDIDQFKIEYNKPGYIECLTVENIEYTKLGNGCLFADKVEIEKQKQGGSYIAFLYMDNNYIGNIETNKIILNKQDLEIY